MKLKLSLILIIFCALTCAAQKSGNKKITLDDKSAVAARRIILEKQILVDELDSQAKNVPLAAVRIFARTKLAEWLWKEGKDETGRAELIAVRAVEEIYEKIDEIAEPRSLKANLFSLLDIHAKETAQRLRAKYNVGAEEDLWNVSLLSNVKDGDKIVADKIRKVLAVEKDSARIGIFLSSLRRQKSPEFLSILFEIIRLQESGVNKYSAASLFWIADFFRDSVVPNDLKTRYYKLVLNKAANTLQFADPREIHFTDLLLFWVLPDMTANAPQLAAEATGIKLELSAKVSQGTKDLQESEQRMRESPSKLEGMISEADRTDNKMLKYSLLERASYLALEEGKFRLAADLIEKTIEEQTNITFPDSESRIASHDQRLTQITATALGKDDFDSADYAAKKIVGDLEKADALNQFAGYFSRKKDSDSALDAYDKALKLTVKADDDKSKYVMLLRLIGTADRIDHRRLSEITSIAAGAINKIPTLNVEDKPGTQKFKDYVSTIMRIGLPLYIVASNLSRTNKNEAVSFTNRFNQKEIRIIADLALAINAFDIENKQISK